MRGSPASARVTSGMSIAVRPSGPTNSSTTSSISSSTAEATAVADSEIVRIAAISARSSTPRPGCGTPVALHARPPSTRSLSVEALGHAAREVHQRAPVDGQRLDRDPLVGAVVAAAGRAELDRGDAGLQERDRVGGAVAADAHRLAVGQRAWRRCRAPARTGSSGYTRAGGQMNERATWTSGIARIWASSSPGSCSGR